MGLKSIMRLQSWSLGRKLWLVLFIFSALGTVLMVINTYAFYEFSGDPKGLRSYRTNEMEYLIFPYYFTFISNVTAVIVAGYATWFKAYKYSVHFERYKVMMATNLTITLIVYWALLSDGIDWTNGFGVTSNMFVHVLTPILAVATFIYSRTEYRDKKLKVGKTLLWNFIMPFAWLTFAIIMYFILGADGKEDAPYSFLNVAHNKWYTTVAIILAVAAAYAILTAFYTYIFKNDFSFFKRRRAS